MNKTKKILIGLKAAATFGGLLAKDKTAAAATRVRSADKKALAFYAAVSPIVIPVWAWAHTMNWFGDKLDQIQKKRG